MAKKEKSIINNPDFFMKVGMAEGTQVVTDYSKIGKAVEEGILGISKELEKQKLARNQQLVEGNKKLEALKEKYPNGIEIQKAGKEWGSMPVDFLKSRREDYDRLSKIVAQGPNYPGYDEAVNGMNEIMMDIEDMSGQFEAIAVARQKALDISSGDGLAASSSDWDQMNLNNIATMDKGFLENSRIEVIDGRSTLIVKDSQGNDVNGEDYGQKIGKQYSHDLRDAINKSLTEVEDLGLEYAKTGKGGWNQKAALRDVQKLARDKDAVIDLVYQEDLIDDYILTQVPNARYDEIFFLRDLYRKPEHKEDITSWFINNQMKTLTNAFNENAGLPVVQEEKAVPLVSKTDPVRIGMKTTRLPDPFANQTLATSTGSGPELDPNAPLFQPSLVQKPISIPTKDIAGVDKVLGTMREEDSVMEGQAAAAGVPDPSKRLTSKQLGGKNYG